MPLLVGTRRAVLGGGDALLPPSFVAKTEGSVTASATVTMALPTSINGDLLLAFLCHNGGGAITAPSGWTEVRTTTLSSGRVLSVWRRGSSGEPASYDWTLAVAVNSAWGMASYRPANRNGAVEVEGGQSNTNAVSSAVAPSVTPSGAPRLLVVAYALSASTVTVTVDPAAMTKRIEQSPSGLRLVVYDQALASSAATGTRTATISAGSTNAGQSMVLRGTA